MNAHAARPATIHRPRRLPALGGGSGRLDHWSVPQPAHERERPVGREEHEGPGDHHPREHPDREQPPRDDVERDHRGVGERPAARPQQPADDRQVERGAGPARDVTDPRIVEPRPDDGQVGARRQPRTQRLAPPQPVVRSACPARPSGRPPPAGRAASRPPRPAPTGTIAPGRPGHRATRSGSAAARPRAPARASRTSSG